MFAERHHPPQSIFFCESRPPQLSVRRTQCSANAAFGEHAPPSPDPTASVRRTQCSANAAFAEHNPPCRKCKSYCQRAASAWFSERCVRRTQPSPSSRPQLSVTRTQCSANAAFAKRLPPPPPPPKGFCLRSCAVSRSANTVFSEHCVELHPPPLQERRFFCRVSLEIEATLAFGEHSVQRTLRSPPPPYTKGKSYCQRSANTAFGERQIVHYCSSSVS